MDMLVTGNEGRRKMRSKKEEEEATAMVRTIRKRGLKNGGCLATRPERQKPYHGDQPKTFGVL
jgi:hypothetical protein